MVPEAHPESLLSHVGRTAWAPSQGTWTSPRIRPRVPARPCHRKSAHGRLPPTAPRTRLAPWATVPPAEGDGPPRPPGRVLATCGRGTWGTLCLHLAGVSPARGWGTRAERAWGLGVVSVNGTAVFHDLRQPPRHPGPGCVCGRGRCFRPGNVPLLSGGPGCHPPSTCRDPDNEPLPLWAWFSGRGANGK